MSGLLSSQFIELYKALSHTMRLGILELLSTNFLSVNELSQHLHKRQSNVSQHLQVLKKNNLVSSKRVGKRRIYKLDNKNEALIKYLSNCKL